MAQRRRTRNLSARAAAASPLFGPGAMPHHEPMDSSAQLWAVAAAAVALALVAGWADVRRTRRRDVDRPGWVPWQPILILAMMAAAVSAALALMV
jgi:hypothetical protein